MIGLHKIKLISFISLMILPCCAGVIAFPKEKQILSTSHNPILFLHGSPGSAGSWNIMRMRFKNDGMPNTSSIFSGYAYDFQDPKNCSAQANINNAYDIKQWVEDILNETGADKVNLVAYSAGGWSSRYYIKFLGGIDKVNNCVSLGTPHSGTPFDNSTCNGLLPFLFSLNENDSTPGGILDDTIGNRVDPFTGVIYNSTHIPGTINYTSIYSPGESFAEYPLLDGAHNVPIEGKSHDQLITDESVYALVKAAIGDTSAIIPLPTFPTTTPTSFSTTTTTNTTTTNPLKTTSETGFSLIPVVLTMGLMALIVIFQRRLKLS